MTPPAPRSIRGQYERLGARAFYEQCGPAYRNPHEPIIAQSLSAACQAWPLDLSHMLDLAAGSGEVTLALRALGAGKIDGIDPFTAEAYQLRTGQAAERIGFAEIAAGALSGRQYSLIACSFALHLCEKSRLPDLCYQLAQISDALLILTPHKRPEIRSAWGWDLAGEQILERVRTPLYRKTVECIRH